MKTPRSAGNPYQYDRHAFAWEYTPAGSPCHLDYGCYDGQFLTSLRRRGVGRLVGADISSEAIALGKARDPGIEFVHLTATIRLPFADATFTSITLLDVLEHVCDQRELLSEFHRVMAPGGRLVVTTPRKYVLSFLDLGNLKFRVPRLHRWYYCRHHSPEEYERRYVSNPDGLTGDISAAKRWHEHFTPQHMGDLLRGNGFQVIQLDGSAFFTRLTMLLNPLVGRFGAYKAIASRVERWDAKSFESMNLFCAADRV